MAQDIVVKDPLTQSMIRAGAALTRKLDELRWPVVASLWLYLPESNQWRLILASPRVKSEGPRKSYERIQTAITSVSSLKGRLALTDIGVVEPEDSLIALLRVAIGTGPTVGGIRFTRNVINGHFIEDAYIYRVSDIAPAGQVREQPGS